jgi:hypothetical protein
MKRFFALLWVVPSIGLALGLAACDMTHADQMQALPPPVVLAPSDLEWVVLPTGVKRAVLFGDSSQPGPFALRLEYPKGYRKAPHFHPNDAYVTVLSGEYYRGYGDTVDESKGIALTPGTFSVNPAGVSHFEWVPEHAVLEVHATGPWATVYVDADGHAVENPHDPMPEMTM